MQSFRQYITELFDQGFVWKWTKQATRVFQAKFETEQYKYQVEITSYGSEWYVDYAAKGKGEIKNYSATIDTEENVSNKVMATVLSIIEDFVNMANPDIITFEAEKNKLGRASFYEKMMQRVLPDDYRVEKDNRAGGMIEFRITKKS